SSAARGCRLDPGAVVAGGLADSLGDRTETAGHRPGDAGAIVLFPAALVADAAGPGRHGDFPISFRTAGLRVGAASGGLDQSSGLRGGDGASLRGFERDSADVRR